MSDKKKRTSYFLYFLLSFIIIVLISFLLWAFGRQGSLVSSEYDLPGKVIERQILPDEFHILKISHSKTVSHPQHRALSEKISFEIKKETTVKIIPEIYPSNELGSPQNQFQALRRGTLEMAILSADELWNIPEFSLFSIPYLFSSYDDLEQFMNHPEVENSLSRYLRSENIRYMGWGFTSPFHIFKLTGNGSANRTVLLSHSSEYLEAFFLDAAYSAQKDERIKLQSDLQALPYGSAEISSEDLDHYDRFLNLESLLYRNYLYVPCLYLMNDAFWNDLSSYEQQVMVDAVDQSTAYERELIRQSEEKYQASLSDHFGISSGTGGPSRSLLAAWREKNPALFVDALKQ